MQDNFGNGCTMYRNGEDYVTNLAINEEETRFRYNGWIIFQTNVLAISINLKIGIHFSCHR